ncbi:hypothetical protein TWF481_004786 [Arthrobotrys musiformis]|uniref:Uncharacterized protein n=1 Tax=Arthrobotrys musiformis TaxID=47236 RepID=A0AAV9WRA7_9PEZI
MPRPRHLAIVPLDQIPNKMFHARKTNNIKDLLTYGGLKPRAPTVAGPASKMTEAKESPSQKRKLRSPNNDLEEEVNPSKRVKRARELMDELHVLTDKGPKAYKEMKGLPMTPQDRVIGDLKIWDYSPPKTSESDKAIRLLVEERMSREAKFQGLEKERRAVVIEARCQIEKKRAKIEELKAKRRGEEGWSSFRSRLERGRLPADRHLRGPMLVAEKRVTRGRVDQDVQDKDVKEILERWRGSAVVEGASKTPVSPQEDRKAAARAAEGEGEKKRRVVAGPAKPRYDFESDLLAKHAGIDVLRAKLERGEIKRGEVLKLVGEEVERLKADLIGSKTKAAEAKKSRLIGARYEILAATQEVKKDLEELKARRRSGETREARMAKRARVAELTEKLEALMAEHERAFDEVVKVERELVELRGKVAKLPIGNSKAMARLADEVAASSTKAVEEVEVEEREGLRRQFRGEKRALRALQRR